MWGRSAAALLGGAGTTATLMLNLAWLSLLPFDVVLLLILLVAFPVWVALAYYCYQARTVRQAWSGMGLLALPSMALNAVLHAQ